MSQMQRKIQFARERGAYVFRMSEFFAKWQNHRKPHIFTYTLRDNKINRGEWAVYVDGWWSPEAGLTKREAVNLAYAAAIARRPKVVFTSE